VVGGGRPRAATKAWIGAVCAGKETEVNGLANATDGSMLSNTGIRYLFPAGTDARQVLEFDVSVLLNQHLDFPL
jgi:hypothetical protein